MKISHKKKFKHEFCPLAQRIRLTERQKEAELTLETKDEKLRKTVEGSTTKSPKSGIITLEPAVPQSRVGKELDKRISRSFSSH